LNQFYSRSWELLTGRGFKDDDKSKNTKEIDSAGANSDERVKVDHEMSVPVTINPMPSIRNTTARFSAAHSVNNGSNAEVEMVTYAQQTELASKAILVKAVATPVSRPPSTVNLTFSHNAEAVKPCPNPCCNDASNRASNPFCWSCNFAFFQTCPNPECAYTMIPHDKKFCGKCRTKLEDVV